MKNKTIIKVGDKLVCDNGKTYTIGEGNSGYCFAILDENGDEINLYHDYALDDCRPDLEDDRRPLTIEFDEHDRLKQTYILKIIKK